MQQLDKNSDRLMTYDPKNWSMGIIEIVSIDT